MRDIEEVTMVQYCSGPPALSLLLRLLRAWSLLRVPRYSAGRELCFQRRVYEAFLREGGRRRDRQWRVDYLRDGAEGERAGDHGWRMRLSGCCVGIGEGHKFILGTGRDGNVG